MENPNDTRRFFVYRLMHIYSLEYQFFAPNIFWLLYC